MPIGRVDNVPDNELVMKTGTVRERGREEDRGRARRVVQEKAFL